VTRQRLILMGVAALVLAVVAVDRLLPPDMSRVNTLSAEVTDRDGHPLRVFLSADGAWRLKSTVADASPLYLQMLKAYEDRRFDRHMGVDGVALARATLQFAAAGHVVSGGSTLTMQVARLLEPRFFLKHGVAAKAFQIVRALQLEERYSKEEILSFYLTLAPMGGNLEGVRAASLAYFGKEPVALGPAESALLVGLPQAPAKLRPDRHLVAAEKSRAKVLARMQNEDVLTAAEVKLANEAPLPITRRAMPFAAPHLSARLVARAGKNLRIVTTLNDALQQAAEKLTAQERAYVDDGADIALVVVENKSRNVIAYVGGTDFWGRAGQMDLASRARSPGSALKPFIYGLAFDNLMLHPLSRIEDAPTNFGDYAPRDFDGEFQGAVTARDALQMSLNIPAVAILEKVGPLAFTLSLQNAGAHLSFPTNDAPTLPVALGGLGISLSDMAMLYAGIANGGEAQGLNFIKAAPPAPRHRLFGPVAAYYLRDILDGVALPEGWAMGQGLHRSRTIGFKTGTSYGFRDAWSVGFSNDYTVAVWVGRADGTPRPDRVGRDVAAPVLLKMFGLLPADRNLAPSPPGGAILAGSSDALPPSLRIFRRAAEPAPVMEAALPPPAIAYPPNGAIVPLPGPREKQLQFKADGGKAPLTWMVNGQLLGSFDRFSPALYAPGGEGLARVTVVDADGKSDTSNIRFKKMR
jgi:penicillin-binding protein 1C